MTRTPRERRAAARLAIGFRAFDKRATVDGAPVEGINISLTGMLVRPAGQPEAPPTVNVTVPGLEPRQARIVWQSKGLLGLQFVEPLTETELTAILAGTQ